MADYFMADERWVYKLPEDLSFEAGALIEPLAVAVHAVKRAGIGLGDTVAVIGAGPIGLLVIAACRASGATDIIAADVTQARLGRASIMGATRTVDSRKGSIVEAALSASGGRGVAKSFECAGSEQTFEQAMRCLCKGGVATVVGIFEQPVIKVPVTLFVSQEITVQGAQGYCWDFEDCAAARRRDRPGRPRLAHVRPCRRGHCDEDGPRPVQVSDQSRT